MPHEREVEARLFAQGVDGEAGAAVFGAAERQAGVGVDFFALEGCFSANRACGPNRRTFRGVRA